MSDMEKQRHKIGVNVFVIRDNKLLLGKRKRVVGDGQWGPRNDRILA